MSSLILLTSFLTVVSDVDPPRILVEFHGSCRTVPSPTLFRDWTEALAQVTCEGKAD